MVIGGPKDSLPLRLAGSKDSSRSGLHELVVRRGNHLCSVSNAMAPATARLRYDELTFDGTVLSLRSFQRMSIQLPVASFSIHPELYRRFLTQPKRPNYVHGRRTMEGALTLQMEPASAKWPPSLGQQEGDQARPLLHLVMVKYRQYLNLLANPNDFQARDAVGLICIDYVKSGRSAAARTISRPVQREQQRSAGKGA
jgi:hypothetical protein